MAVVRASPHEHGQVMYDRLAANWRCSVTQCVEKSSAETYATAWQHYLRMCTSLHCDPLMRTQHPAYARDAARQQISYGTMMILLFIAYLQTPTDPADDRKPPTIASYVSGLRHYWRVHFLYLDGFSHPLVAQYKRALTLTDPNRHEAKDFLRLPFTVDMLQHAKVTALDMSSIEGQCIALALEVQLTMLHRVSEILPTTDDHYMRAVDVIFQLSVAGTTVYVPADAACRHDVRNLRGVMFTTRSAKNDQGGNGSRIFIDVHDTSSPHVAFCFASDTFRWAHKARPRGADSLFSYRNKWQLTPDAYGAAIKAVAKSMGLDPSRYSSHSLRIAGASALAAAGKPDWFIKKMGRWQSLAFLQYIQFSVPSMREAVTTIISPSCFTIADLIATHPGFSPRGGG